MKSMIQKNSFNTNNKNSFLGIDGCKYGYVAVNITENAFEIEIFKTIEKYAQNIVIVF